MVVVIVAVVPTDFFQEIGQMRILSDMEQFDISQCREILEMLCRKVLAIYRMVCPACMDPCRAPGLHIRERFPQYARHRKRSEEHTSELQSLMRNSYAVFCLKK